MSIEVSIIIPTLNRAQSLSRTLSSLHVQDYPADAFEVIVVDNGSEDETPETVKTFAKSWPDIAVRYLFDDIPGMLTGRHRGALEARGDLLIFIDDDISADPGWLQAIVKSFKDPEVHIVGGRNMPEYELPPPDWLAMFWVRHHHGILCGELSLLDFGDKEKWINPDLVWGLNFSIRKRTLYELGGFHPDCIPDHLQHLQGDGETGLTRKAKQKGYKALYQPKALVYHEVPASRMSPAYFSKRYFYQGVCDSYTHIRDGRKLNMLAGSVSTLWHRALARLPFGMKWRLKQKMKVSYLKGYRFHQRAAGESEKVLQWVLRKDYWDYRLPESFVMNTDQNRCP